MLYYGLDAAYAPTAEGFKAITPPPNWFAFYTGGPSIYHQWTLPEVQALCSTARPLPIFDGQNAGTNPPPVFSPAQGQTDAHAALDALEPFQSAGPFPGYVLDLEDDSWQAGGEAALAYADSWGAGIRANSGLLPILYGDAAMFANFRPSGPFGLWAARYPGIAASPPPNLSEIPVDAETLARFAWISWQYWAGGNYDLSVSDDRLWSTHPMQEPDNPGQPFTAADGSAAAWFPATGFTVAHGFYQYWLKFGGLPVFGNPISREYVRLDKSGEGLTCQMFERARFEWHPRTNAQRFDVELGLIGDELVSRSNEAITYPAAFVKEAKPQ